VWDDRKRRIKIVQMLLGQRYVFNRRRRGLGGKFGEFVDPDPTQFVIGQWSLVIGHLSLVAVANDQ
jgi:hypothetical protein